MKRIALVIVFLMGLSYQVSVFSQDNKSRKEPIAIEESVTPEMYISPDNKLILKNAPVGKQVQIFTIIGNKIRDIKIKNPDEEHVLNLPRGVYIFKMDGIVKRRIIR
jgi:hypothetical protein